MKTRATLSPRRATTTLKIWALNRDNIASGQAAILVSEKHVSIWQDDKSGYFRIPRKNFNTLIDWYNKEQKIKS